MTEQMTGSWDLVRAAQGGDREAFARLYRDYAPGVSRFVSRRFAGDPGLVEDLTSETFLRAWRRINTVHDQGRDVGAWLTTIAGNLVKDHYKAARTRYEQVSENVSEPRGGRAVAGGEANTDPQTQVLGGFDRDAAAVTVRAALAGLTPGQRQVIEMYDLGLERDLSAVAERVGRHVGAVKVLRHRGLRSMRNTLTDAGLGSPQQCVDAVGRAQAAVDSVVAGRHRASRAAARIEADRCEAGDRWAAGSVAAEVGSAVLAQ